MKLAGIITTKNYTDRYKSLLTMRKLVDVLIVLDDNSDTPISKKDYPYIDLLITQKHNEPFNCQANRTILFYWAGHYNCNWALQLDDDMILSNKINNRNLLNPEICSISYLLLEFLFLSIIDLFLSGMTFLGISSPNLFLFSV